MPIPLPLPKIFAAPATLRPALEYNEVALTIAREIEHICADRGGAELSFMRLRDFGLSVFGPEFEVAITILQTRHGVRFVLKRDAGVTWCDASFSLRVG